MARYVALVPVHHSVTGKYHAPGESLDLDHCTREQIEYLKASGYVAEVPDGVSSPIQAPTPARRAAAVPTSGKKEGE